MTQKPFNRGQVVYRALVANLGGKPHVAVIPVVVVQVYADDNGEALYDVINWEAMERPDGKRWTSRKVSWRHLFLDPMRAMRVARDASRAKVYKKAEGADHVAA